MRLSERKAKISAKNQRFSKGPKAIDSYRIIARNVMRHIFIRISKQKTQKGNIRISIYFAVTEIF